MNRTMAAGLAAAGFLVVGGVSWIGGMPKPAPIVGSYAEVDATTSTGILAADGNHPLQAAPTAQPTGPAVLVDPDWLVNTATATGIPQRALLAYASAAVDETNADPDCGVTWNTIAAIGDVESDNGAYDGAILGDDGTVSPPIIGPALDGRNYAAIKDTDAGKLDGDATWDHAVGPMQFIPATWVQYGADANGDGVADPQNLDDAALTAAVYLCAVGGDLSTGTGWLSAIGGYNTGTDYLDRVRDLANQYAGMVTQ